MELAARTRLRASSGVVVSSGQRPAAVQSGAPPTRVRRMEARAQLLRRNPDGSSIGTSAVGELSETGAAWSLDLVVGPAWLPQARERLSVTIAHDSREGDAVVEELLPLPLGRARVSLSGLTPLRTVAPGWQRH